MKASTTVPARLPLALAALTLVIAACGGGDGTTGAPAEAPGTSCDSATDAGFVVEGALENRSGVAIPDDAGVYVTWIVFTDTDHGYVYGTGCIDAENDRFTVTLPADPPDAAVNVVGECRLGMGAVMVATGEVPEGSDLAAALDEEPGRVLGAAPRSWVIYTAGDCSGLGAEIPWLAEFPTGYAVGACVPNPGGFGGFDGFAPAAATSVTVELVDDPEALDWCNWT